MEPHPAAHVLWKRVFDLAFGLLFLIVSFPLFVLVALAVRLTSRGPVIYRSRRIGLGGRPICMFKFRSMYVDADERLPDLWPHKDHEGPVFKMRRDPRVTPVGRFIRRYSLDELPQFFNVLKGDLSMVGPRPLHAYEIERLSPEALLRLSVRPGLTCYWQVMGRSRLSLDEWMNLDRKYIAELGLITDLKILARTPRAILSSDGAY